MCEEDPLKYAQLITPHPLCSKHPSNVVFSRNVVEKEIKRQSIIETVKEIKLKKEDTKMKAIETQIMMKRLQESQGKCKKNEWACRNEEILLGTSNSLEVDVLEHALAMIRARRKLIQKAIRQQRLVTAERHELAAKALARQKQLEQERLRLAEELHVEERQKQAAAEVSRQRTLSAALRTQSATLEKVKTLVAHNNLAQESNKRVTQKLQNLSLKRAREAQRLREVLAKQQLAELTASLDFEAKKKTKIKKRPLLRTSSPLMRLTNAELSQLLTWLDMERNAQILAANDKKITAKNMANKAAQSLIRNAALTALGQDADLTDTEVDDLLGLAELGAADDSLDGLDYYADDYPVDLEEILVDYEYEFDEPLAPTLPVTPVLPIPPVAPAEVPAPAQAILPAPPPVAVVRLQPQKPLTPLPLTPPLEVPKLPQTYYHSLNKVKPQSHSYQYFHQQVHPGPHNYHSLKPHFPTPDPYHEQHHHLSKPYHEPGPYKKPYHDNYNKPTKPQESYHEPEPFLKPYPKPQDYHVPYRNPKPHQENYNGLKAHRESYHEFDSFDHKQGPYHAPYPKKSYRRPAPPREERYQTPKPHQQSPKQYHSPDSHYDPDQYYQSTPVPVSIEPYRDLGPYHAVEPPGHNLGPYDNPTGHKRLKALYQEDYYEKPPITHTPGAQFLADVAPVLDTGINTPQARGFLRQSLLRDIQDKLDAELNLGPGGQHTRVIIGQLPSPPPRRGLRRRPPIGVRRTNEDAAANLPLETLVTGDPTTAAEEKNDVNKRNFSELMADFLVEDPLPFRESRGAN